MEFTYNKSGILNILKTILYYFLWGVSFNILLFLVTWISSKWEFLQLYHNPYLTPFRGLWFWIVLGFVVGWFKRSQKNRMTLKKWARNLLYIVFFGAFVMSLQLYYVHRKHGGWNGLRGGTECVHKYQSYFLIKDRQHFANLDACLVNQKRREDPDYNPTAKNYMYPEDRQGVLMDYDIINPRLIWGLIIFLVVGVIEILRRYGPIRFYKNFGAFLDYWQKGLSSFKNKQWELIFLGSLSNLLVLYLLPKINGLPNDKLPLFLSLAVLMLMFKGTIRRPGGDYFSNTKNLQWFYFAIGLLLSNVLLILAASKVFYILLIISIGGYLYTSKIVSWSFVKPVVVLLLVLDADFLFALDDGTWPEGTSILDDSHGPVSMDQSAENGSNGAAAATLAQENGEEEEEEEEDTGGFRNPFDASQVDTETATSEQIMENVSDLKSRLESSKETHEDLDTQNRINGALEELEKVLEIVTSGSDLSADDVKEINELLKQPNEVYNDIVGI